MTLCIRAWFDLSTTRSTGGMGGSGPIPWHLVISWCEHEGLDREATRVVVAVLRRLDRDRADTLNSLQGAK